MHTHSISLLLSHLPFPQIISSIIIQNFFCGSFLWSTLLFIKCFSFSINPPISSVLVFTFSKFSAFVYLVLSDLFTFSCGQTFGAYRKLLVTTNECYYYEHLQFFTDFTHICPCISDLHDSLYYTLVIPKKNYIN